MSDYIKEKIKQVLFITALVVFMILSTNIKHKITVLFFCTIINFILKILDFGTMSLISMAIGSFFKLFSIETALSSFSQNIIWQISIFLFLSQALIQSGLSKRIALNILYWFGESTLKLSYGVCLLVTLFAIIVPTSTARIGGLIIPIINDILNIISGNNKKVENLDDIENVIVNEALDLMTSSDTDNLNKQSIQDDEKAHDKLRLNIIFSVLYSNTIASAIFLSASAGNFYIQKILESMNLPLTGNQWLLNSFVPGLICLGLLPILIQYFTTQTDSVIPNLKQEIKKEIQELGPICIQEIIMILTFSIMFLAWIFSEVLNVNFVSILFVLVAILLLSDLLDFQKDIIKNEDSWNTFFWLSNILMLSDLINQQNAFDFIINFIQNHLYSIPKVAVFLILLTFYGYSQYLFASSTVHISSFFEIVLNLMIAYRFPPMLSILSLSYTSNLFAGLTNYSSSEVILLSTNYNLNTKKFIKTGFKITTILYTSFMAIGILWWRITGVY